MALAPKGDPRRPLQLAVRSMRLLGIVLILLSLLVLVALAVSMRRAAAPPTRSWLMFGLIAGVYLVPGVLYVVCSAFLHRRQPWAATLALVLASLQTAFALLALAGNIASGASVLSLLLLLLLLAALAQLIMNLAQSYRAIREWPGDERLRGFEPLAVAASGAAQSPTPPQYPHADDRYRIPSTRGK